MPPVCSPGAKGLLAFALLASATWAETTQPASAPATDTWFRISTQTTQLGVPSTVQLLNTADGTVITQFESGDNLRITLQDPRTMESLDYVAASRELRRGELAPWLKDGLVVSARGQLASFTWEAASTRWKAALGAAWTPPAPVADGECQRYELAAAIPALTASPRRGGPLAGIPDVLWVDAAGRFRKATTHFGTATRGWDVTVTYDYNLTGYGDIYAAGAPRNARIIDNRPSAEVRAILQRLESRHGKGFGDCVAFLSESLLDTEGGLDPVRTTVRMLARKGNQGLAHTFTTVPKLIADASGLQLPPRWPHCSFTALLTAAQNGKPDAVFAFDGQRAFSGKFRRGQALAQDNVDRNAVVQASNVATYIWPNPWLYNRYTPEVRVRLLTDEQRRGLVGLEFTRFGPANDFYYAQTIHWIDPQRDDVLLESSVTNFRGGSPLNRQDTTETRVHEVQRLPDGRYLPARWTVVARRPNADGFLDPIAGKEYRLWVSAEKSLEDAWMPWAEKSPATSSAPARR